MGRLRRPAPARALLGTALRAGDVHAPRPATRRSLRILPDSPAGERWSGSWTFTAVDPIDSFEALDGEDNADDENMPAAMRFTFETTATGSRMTCVTRFSSVEAMEQTIPGMEEGLRAAMPQLDAVLAEQRPSAAHA